MSTHSSDDTQEVLVDGSSYLYRAFHALPQLVNSSGQPTGAIKGVINMLRRLIADYPQGNIIVIFDAKGKTFRNEMYSEYKANRPPMPDDLRCQIKPLHDIIKAMGLPLLIIEGVEADDVIGTLACKFTELGKQSIISTGDKDMAQLVNEQVTLINTMSNLILDIKGVNEKFGIPPDLIIDYLALMGDKVDNIPGVPGVGEKTALMLLQEIGGLDKIYINIDTVSTLALRGANSVKKKLLENKEKAYLSYELATIKKDVELNLDIDDLNPSPPNENTLLDLYKNLEFKSLITEIENTPAQNNPKTAEASTVNASNYKTIIDEETLESLINQLKSSPLFAIDTETTGLNYMQDDLVGLSFSSAPGEAYYIPFSHDYLDAPIQLSQDYVLEKIKPLLESNNAKKVGQNLKFDKNILAKKGIILRGIAFDTMLESYVLNSTASRHNMDSLAAHYLNKKTQSFEDIAGKGVKQLTFNQISIDVASPYACEDADITLQLHKVLWKELEKNPKLQYVFETIELPLLSTLSHIERTGTLVDANLLGKQSIELAEKLKNLERQAFELVGREFNLGSPKQLQEILFQEMELPIIKKTPKGQASTAEDVLESLAVNYDLPRVILEYRSLSKLKTTYTDKLPTMIDPLSGRIHTSYHQAVTATGRLSSSDPNLQNIPIKSEEGRRIRQAFVAPENKCLIAADYSQVELRIMAHLSQDIGLLSAFHKNIDIHSATASEIFGIPIDELLPTHRRSAKAINFGLIYGMSAFGLSNQLGISRKSAQEYIDLYFSRYPGVSDYMTRIKSQALEQGYVETLLGRRLHLPEINSRNRARKQAAERAAINAPMQGTAADIIKIAMIKINNWLEQDEISAKIVMQVHDELVLEVENNCSEIVINGVRKHMMAAANLDVPLVVDIGIGANWDEAH